jgi:hypothetical protein
MGVSAILGRPAEACKALPLERASASLSARTAPGLLPWVPGSETLPVVDEASDSEPGAPGLRGGTQPSPEALERSGPDRLATILLLLATLIGLTRFVRLGEWSLWLDEALTLADSLHGEFLGQKNPLGYLLFGSFFEALGHRPDELELRLLAAIFGWATIPLTYWAFAPFSGRRVAGAAALLVAASSWHVYWSQTARFYTLAQFLGLAGSGLMLRGYWRDSILRVLAGLVLFGASCLTHLSGAFLLPALVGIPFLSRFFGWRIPGASGRVGKLLLVIGVVGLAFGAQKVAYEVWFWQRVKGVGTPFHLLLTTGFFVTPLLGVGALVGGWVALRRREPFMLLCLGVCAVVTAEATLASLRVRVSAQYLFVLLPWIALLAALPVAPRALESAPSGPSRAVDRRGVVPWAYLLALFLPALTTVGLYLSVRKGERPRWREAYAFVHEQRGPDDLVLGMDAPVGEYYLSSGRTDLRNLYSLAYLDRFRANLPRQWARFDRRTWFVVNHEQFEDWDADVADRMRETLRTECRLAARFPLVVESRDLSVYVYLRE